MNNKPVKNTNNTDNNPLPFTLSEYLENAPKVRIGTEFVSYAPDQKLLKNIGKENLILPLDRPQEWYGIAIENQTRGKRWGNAFVKFGTGFGSAFIQSVSDFAHYAEALGHGGDPFDPTQYSKNFLDSWSNKLDEIGADAEIYYDPDTMASRGYWANQIGNIGTSVGMVISTVAESYLLTLATDGAGAGLAAAKVADTIGKLTKLGKAGKIGRLASEAMFNKRTLVGIMAGTQETMMNTRETYNTTLQKVLEQGVDESTAKQIAREAASIDGNMEIWTNVLGDIALFNMLNIAGASKQLKTIAKNPSSLEARAAMQSMKLESPAGTFSDLVERAAGGLTKNIKSPGWKAFANLGIGVGSEGLEEVVQGGIQRYSSFEALKNGGDELDQELNQEYLDWKQAVFDLNELRDEAIGGGLGGLLFGAWGAYSNAKQDRAYKKAQANALQRLEDTKSRFYQEEKDYQTKRQGLIAQIQEKQKSNTAADQQEALKLMDDLQKLEGKRKFTVTDRKISVLQNVAQMDMQGWNHDGNSTDIHRANFEGQLDTMIKALETNDHELLQELKLETEDSRLTENERKALLEDYKETRKLSDEYFQFLEDNADFTLQSLPGVTQLFSYNALENNLTKDRDAGKQELSDLRATLIERGKDRNVTEQDVDAYLAETEEDFRKQAKDKGLNPDDVSKIFTSTEESENKQGVAKLFDSEAQQMLGHGLSSYLVKQSDLNQLSDLREKTIDQLRDGSYNDRRTAEDLINPKAGILLNATKDNTTKNERKKYRKQLEDSYEKGYLTEAEYKFGDKLLSKLENSKKKGKKERLIDRIRNKNKKTEEEIEKLNPKARIQAEALNENVPIDVRSNTLFDDIAAEVKDDEWTKSDDGSETATYIDSEGKEFTLVRNPDSSKQVFIRNEETGELEEVVGTKRDESEDLSEDPTKDPTKDPKNPSSGESNNNPTTKESSAKSRGISVTNQGGVAINNVAEVHAVSTLLYSVEDALKLDGKIEIRPDKTGTSAVLCNGKQIGIITKETKRNNTSYQITLNDNTSTFTIRFNDGNLLGTALVVYTKDGKVAHGKPNSYTAKENLRVAEFESAIGEAYNEDVELLNDEELVEYAQRANILGATIDVYKEIRDRIRQEQKDSTDDEGGPSIPPQNPQSSDSNPKPSKRESKEGYDGSAVYGSFDDMLFHISQPIEDMDPTLLEYLTSAITDAVETFKQQSKNGQFPTWDQFIKRMKMGIAMDGGDTAEQTRRLDEMYGFLANVWKHLREENPDYKELQELTPEVIAKVYQKHVNKIGVSTAGITNAIEEYQKRKEQRRSGQQPTSQQPTSPQTSQPTSQTPTEQSSSTPIPQKLPEGKTDTTELTYDEYQGRVLDSIDYHSDVENTNKNVEPDLTASYRTHEPIERQTEWSDDSIFKDHERGLKSDKLLTGEVKEGDEFTLVIPNDEILNSTPIYYYELVKDENGNVSAELRTVTWEEFKAGNNILNRELTENDALYWRYIPLYAQDANGDNVFSIATESRFQNPSAIGFEILPTDSKEEIQEKNRSRKAVQIEGMAKLNALRFEVAQNYRANHNQNAIADNNTHTKVKVTKFVRDTGYAVSVYNSENAEQTEFKRITEVRSDAKKTQYGYIKFDKDGNYSVYRPNGKPIFARDIYHDFIQHLDKTQINGLLVEIKESPVDGKVVIIPIQYGGLPTAEQSQLGGELRAYIIDSLLNGSSKAQPLRDVLGEINAANSTKLVLEMNWDLFKPYHRNARSKTVIQITQQGNYCLSYWDRNTSILTRIISFRKEDGSIGIQQIEFKCNFDSNNSLKADEIRNVELDLTNTAEKNALVAKLQTALNHFVVSPYLMNMSGKRVKTINTSSRTITYYTIDSSGVKTPKTVHIKDVLDDSAQTSFLSHPVEKADGTVQDTVLFQPKVKIESTNEQKIDPIDKLDLVQEKLKVGLSTSIDIENPNDSGQQNARDSKKPVNDSIDPKTDENPTSEDNTKKPTTQDELTESLIDRAKHTYGENSREAKKREDLLRKIQNLVNGGSNENLNLHINHRVERIDKVTGYTDSVDLINEKATSTIIDYVFNQILSLLKNNPTQTENWKTNQANLLKEKAQAFAAHSQQTIDEYQQQIAIVEEWLKNAPEDAKESGYAAIKECQDIINEESKNIDVFNSILETEKLDSIFKSVSDKIDQVFKIKSISETVTEKQTETEESETESDTVDMADDQTNERIYSKESFEENRKATVNKLVKLLLSGVEKESSGFLNLPTYWSFDEIYNAVIVSIIRNGGFDGTFNGFLEVLEKTIKDTDDGRIKGAYEIIKNVTDTRTQNAIASAFQGYYLNQLFVLNEKSESSRVYSANVRDSEYAVKKSWMSGVQKLQTQIKLGKLSKVEIDKLLSNKETVEKLIVEYKTAKEDADVQQIEEKLFNAIKKAFASVQMPLDDKAIKQMISSFSFPYKVNGEINEISLDRLFQPSENGKTYHSPIGVVYSILKSYQDKLNGKPSFFDQYDTEKNWLSDSRSVLNTFAEMNAAFQLGDVTSMIYDNGKLIYTFAANNFTSVRTKQIVDGIKSDEQSFLEADPYSRHSKWLKELKKELNPSEEDKQHNADRLEENPGYRPSKAFSSEFNLQEAAITPYRNEGKANDQKGTELNGTDQEAMRFSFVQDEHMAQLDNEEVIANGETISVNRRLAKFVFPTISDKTRIFLQTGIKYQLQSLTAEQRIAVSKELLFDQLVMPELDRICRIYSVTAEQELNWSNVAEAGKLFLFLPYLNNLTTEVDGAQIPYFELLAWLRNGIDTLENDSTKADELQAARDDYNRFFAQFKKEAQDAIWEHIELEVNEKLESPIWQKVLESPNKSILNSDYIKSILLEEADTADSNLVIAKIAATDYIVNNYLGQANIFMLYSLDPFQYASGKFDRALQSAIKENTDEETGHINWANIDFVKLVNEGINENHNKRMAGMSASGKQIAAEVSPNYVQIVAQDRINATANFDFIIDLFVEENNKTEAHELYKQYTEAIGNPVLQDELISKLKKLCPSVSDYLEIESTNAQEYTTLQEHIDVMYGKGELTQEQYDTITEKLEHQYEKEERGETLTMEDYLNENELKTVLQPMKPVHYDTITDPQTGLQRMVYVKSSSLPLIPQMTSGTPLDAVRRAMEQIGHQSMRKVGKQSVPMGVRLTYTTAVKAGAPKDQLELWNSNSTLASKVSLDQLRNQMAASSLVLNRTGFKIQQEIPIHEHEEISVPTQLQKLVMGAGISSIEEEIFKINGERVNGQTLLEKYEEAFDRLNVLKYNKFCKRLGIDPETQKLKDDSIETKRKFIEEIRKLLIDEATNRNYPKQDIEALQLIEITNVDGDLMDISFTLPIWATTQSTKFESLLHSVFNKRLMKYKLPGYSCVCSTSTGWLKETISKEKRSSDNQEESVYDQIVYTSKAGKNWDGELKGARFETITYKNRKTGEIVTKTVFRPAQILLPAKFRGADGKLIRLINEDGTPNEEYVTTKLVGGKKRYVLKSKKISRQLEKIVGLRIPTSSHVSMAAFEIVGFLPPIAGDVAIIPENLNVQMGLDYDVDKLYFMTPSIYVSKDGYVGVKRARKAKVETQTEVKEQTDQLVETKETEQKTTDQQTSENQSDIKNEDEAYTAIYDAVQSVLNCPDPRVQSRISNVLSMEHADHTADVIDSHSRKSEASQLILSDSHQKKMTELGSVGKIGIGIYSNALVMASQLQQTHSENGVARFVFEDGEEPVTSITIGDKVFGELCSTEKLNGIRTMTEAFAEKQNTATDNAKKNTLGRANVTISDMMIDCFLTMMGVDLEEVTVDGKKTLLNWSYLLFSQPAVKEYKAYKERKNTVSKGLITETESFTEKEIIEKSFEELDADFELMGVDGFEFPELTAQNLFDQLTADPTSEKSKAIQNAALKFYISAQQWSKSIMNKQAFVGITKEGLGSTVAKAQTHLQDIGEAIEDTKVLDGGSLTSSPLGRQTVRMSDLYTSVFSQVFLNAQRGYNIYANQLLDVLGISSDSARTATRQEIFDSFKEFLNTSGNTQLYSVYEDTDVTQEDVAQNRNKSQSDRLAHLRETLLVDSKHNTSLASYLHELLYNEEYKDVILDNPLLSSFTYKLCNSFDQSGRGLSFSTINFSINQQNNLDESDLYHSIDKLIAMNIPLPDKNGQSYTTKQLAIDLITYTYMGRSIQGGVEFVKYIPVDYLKNIGYATAMRVFEAEPYQFAYPQMRINWDLVKDERTGNDVPLPAVLHNLPQFIVQYMQHNYQKAKYARNVRIDSKGRYQLFDDDRNVTTTETSPLFVYTMTNKQPRLFVKERIPGFNKGEDFYFYVELNLLGNNQVSEYDYNYNNPRVPIKPSLLASNARYDERVIEDQTGIIDNDKRQKTGLLNDKVVLNIDGVSERTTSAKTSVFDTLTSLKETILSNEQLANDPEYKKILAYIDHLITENGEDNKLGLKQIGIAYGAKTRAFSFEKVAKDQGVETNQIDGVYLGKKTRDGKVRNNNVLLNPDSIMYSVDEETNTLTANGTEGVWVMLHELTHGLTTHALMGTYERVGSKYRAYNDSPAYVKNIVSIYNEALANKELFKNAQCEYGLTNLNEFIAETMSNPDFVKVLEQIKSPFTDRSLFQRFVNFIQKLLGVKPDTLAYDAVHTVLEIIEHQSIESLGDKRTIDKSIESQGKKPGDSVRITEDNLFGDQSTENNSGNGTIGEFNPGDIDPELLDGGAVDLAFHLSDNSNRNLFNCN